MKPFTRLTSELKIKQCSSCGVPFSKPRDYANTLWLKRKYCSVKCAVAVVGPSPERAHKISATQKGRTLSENWRKAISTARKGIKFSEAHRSALKISLKGRKVWNKGLKGKQVAWNKGKSNTWAIAEKNINWKGGITSANRAARESLQYKEWRTHVFQRDDYTCQACGVRGGRLEADHELPFSLYPALRFEILNGRTFCKSCHRKYGWNTMKHNNPRRKADTLGFEVTGAGTYDGFVVGQNI